MGCAPPYDSWDATGLAGIHIPSLFIVGDQDDVADYEHGVKRIFTSAINSDRCMLVYENARHNTGGNPPPPGLQLDFRTLQSFEEPVWRKDRITAINQHFITAYLDLYLKGDESRRSFLHPAVARSNDGQWPLAPGQSAGSESAKEVTVKPHGRDFTAAGQWVSKCIVMALVKPGSMETQRLARRHRRNRLISVTHTRRRSCAGEQEVNSAPATRREALRKQVSSRVSF